MIIKYVAIFILGYLGFSALSLSMQRHYAEIFGRHKVLNRTQYLSLRLLGWLLIAFSYAVSIASQGWGVGSVMWLGILMLAGLLLVLMTAYLPHLTFKFITLKLVSFLVVLILTGLNNGQI